MPVSVHAGTGTREGKWIMDFWTWFVTGDVSSWAAWAAGFGTGFVVAIIRARAIARRKGE